MGNLGINSKYILKTDNLKKYLSDLSKIKIMTSDEYNSLILDLKVCDITESKKKVIMDKLVINSLKYVVSIAKNYQSEEHFIEDLVSEGNLGLLEATKHYDPENNDVKFLSYASYWIRKFILLYVEGTRTVAFPTAVVSRANKVGTFIRSYYAKFGYEPTMSVLNANGFELVDITFYQSYNKRGFDTLNQMVGDEDTFELIDLLSSTDNDHKEEDSSDLKFRLNYALSKLDSREEELIRDLFGIDRPILTVFETSKKYKLTEERIRQLKVSSINYLKKFKQLLS